MRWKWILGIIAVALLMVIVSAFVILSTYDFNRLKPHVQNVVYENTGRKLDLEGDVHLNIGLKSTLAVEDVRFQNAHWGSRPDMLKIARCKVQVALIPLLRRDIVVKELVLEGPDLLIETDRSGVSNLAFEPKKEPKGEASEGDNATKATFKPLRLTLQRILIKGGRFVYRDNRSGKAHTVTVERLTALTPGLERSVDVELKCAYNDIPVQVTGGIGSLMALIDPARAWPLKIEAQAPGGRVMVDGALRNPLALQGVDLKFSTQWDDVGTLERLAGRRFPGGGNYSASGRVVDTAPRAYRISEARITLGGSDISGALEADLAGDRPRFAGTFSSKTLDLNALLGRKEGPVAVEGREGKSGRRRGKVFPDHPLTLEFLKVADADIGFSAGRVLLSDLELNDFAVDVALSGGRLEIEEFKASSDGGAVGGHLTLESMEGTAKLAGALGVQDVDAALLLRQFGAAEFVRGRCDIDVEFRSRGKSVAGMMGMLDGKTSVVMGKGLVENKYIDLLGGDLSSTLFGLLDPHQKTLHDTEINCFVSRFDIKNGLATSTAFVFDTPHTSVAGGGRIDLKTEKLDMLFKASPKQGLGASGLGKVSLSLGQLAGPLKLGGTLADPSLAVDAKATAITLGKAVGGVVLFGPVGILAALANPGPGEENACLAAIETAKSGVRVKREPPKDILEKTAEGVKDAFESVGKTLKKLFKK